MTAHVFEVTCVSPGIGMLHNSQLSILSSISPKQSGNTFEAVMQLDTSGKANVEKKNHTLFRWKNLEGCVKRVSDFASEARRTSTRLGTRWGGPNWCITVRRSLFKICTD